MSRRRIFYNLMKRTKKDLDGRLFKNYFFNFDKDADPGRVSGSMLQNTTKVYNNCCLTQRNQLKGVQRVKYKHFQAMSFISLFCLKRLVFTKDSSKIRDDINEDLKL